MHNIISILVDIFLSPSNTDILYLDPGSGSILIQLVIASALGAALVLKTSWGKIKKFFRRSKDEPQINDENNTDDEI